MKLENKVAVVTGGCSGLGAAVVTALEAKGLKLIVLDLNAKSEDDTDQKKHFSVDVRDRSAVENALDAGIDALGGLNICVNCAGIAPAKKLIDREGKAMPIDAFQNTIDINLVGTFNLCAVAAERMQNNVPEGEAAERGVIINTASVAAYDGQKGQCAYAASKGAIASMTLPLARDLAGLGIRVMSIAPGVMGTPMLLAMPEKVQEGLVAGIPFPKRLGLPAEFASLVQHIVENAYLNGETIRLDGALRMQ